MLLSRTICTGTPLNSLKRIDLNEMEQLMKYTNDMIANGWKCNNCNCSKLKLCDATLMHVPIACLKCNTLITKFYMLIKNI